jgi:signal recognition particle subunit SRP54
MGVGEKPDALEPFDPERVASRILGMGDVLALVEQVKSQVNVQEAEQLARKVMQGKGMTLEDLRSQLQQLQAMGGVSSLMDKLPGQLSQKAGAPELGDKAVQRQIAVIDSMTRRERRRPEIVDGSRRRRIAAGAGVQIQDVKKVLQQFQQMQTMMKSLKGGGLQRLMRGFKGKMPGMPPG